MARKAIKEVRGLSIYLQGISLVLPDSVVLQILPSADISPVDNAPTWLLGTINWHKLTVPVLSFEAASNHQYNPMEDPRVMVLKSINNIQVMPFYAIPLSGIPKPARMNEENITVVENASPSSPLILNEALFDGEPVSIPNLDALEEMLISQHHLFAEETPVA